MYSSYSSVASGISGLLNQDLPERIALVESDRQWTYAELAAATNALKAELIEAGARPGSCIIVNTGRSARYVMAMLAILDLEAVFLPADPSWSEAWLHTLAKKVGATLMLEANGIKRCGSVGREYAADIRYLLATSGSTGMPKIVLGTLHPLGHFLAWYHASFPDHGPHHALGSGLCYDPVFRDVLVPLSACGTLFIPPQQVLYSLAYPGWLADKGITSLHVTPSVLRILVETARSTRQVLPDLHYVFSGGEHLLPALVHEVHNAFPGVQLVNFYGLSETPQAIIQWRVPRPFTGNSVPVGKPIPGVEVSIASADAEGRGEVVITSSYLAHGYLDDKSDIVPFGNCLHTADLGHLDDDGNLHLTGRVDRTVKVNAVRVDLDGVEALISRHPGVTAVRVESTTSGTLLAFHVSSAQVHAALPAWLAERLPPSHLPARFIPLDALPLTRNGKVDASALLRLASQAPAVATQAASGNALEVALLRMFREHLQNTGLGLDVDFFDLGGSSLDAIRFVNKVQSELGVIVYVLSLYEAPTMRRFARKLQSLHPRSMAERFKLPLTLDDGPWQDIADKMPLLDACLSQYPAPDSWQGPKIPAVFILGAPRSGTTLLRVILNGHSCLFSPPALYLLQFTTLAERAATYTGAHAFWKEGAVTALAAIPGMDEAQAESWLAQLENTDAHVMAVYRRLVEGMRPRLLVDKTANYAIDMRILHSMERWFDARYIYLARHPAASIHSFMAADLATLFHSRVPCLREQGPDLFSARELAELVWLRSHQNIQQFLAGISPARQFQTSYEQLVENPESTVSGICSFLELPFEPGMLKVYDDSHKRMTTGIGESIMTGDPKFLQHKNISTDSVAAWRKHLKEESLSPLTWQVASQVGYSPQATQAIDGTVLLAPTETPGAPRVFSFYSLNSYRELAALLLPHANLHAAHVAAESFETASGADAARTVEDLAAAYVQVVRQRQAHGPYYLIGHSFAGLLALEVARRLREQGESIGWVCLLDTRLLGRNVLLRRFARWLGFRIRTPDAGQAMRKGMRKLMTRNVYHDRVIFFQSNEQYAYQKLLQKLWWRKSLAGELEWHNMDATHFNLLTRPCVADIADILCRNIASVQAQHLRD